MSEEIKQKAREDLQEFALINEMYIRGFPMGKLEALIDSLLSQELQKRDSELLERIKFDMKGRNSLIVEIEDIEQILKEINSNN